MIRVEVLDDSNIPAGEVELANEQEFYDLTEQLPDGWELQVIGAPMARRGEGGQ